VDLNPEKSPRRPEIQASTCLARFSFIRHTSARSVPPIKVILGQDGDNFRAFTMESPTRITESFSFRVTD
ncbi:MAG: hypothetical protein WCI46_16055, partial [Verrucomicrobiota bacterium]